MLPLERTLQRFVTKIYLNNLKYFTRLCSSDEFNHFAFALLSPFKIRITLVLMKKRKFIDFSGLVKKKKKQLHFYVFSDNLVNALR